MHTHEYSKHLGLLSHEQFQMALNRFGLGKFLHAEPIPFGLFGQNVFVTSTEGEFVLHYLGILSTQWSYALGREVNA